MKKIVLAAVALSTISLSAIAQTRMTLHEEFTGENCPPCASTNPGFWALCNSGTNPSKLIHIAYMSPIPTSGWYYLRNKVANDARLSYYSISSAPSGKYDGTATGSGHPASFTQANIDAEAAVASPFNMTVANAWNSTYDGVVTTVTITCVTPFTTTSTFNLRAALIQTDIFSAPPGTNGESHFENVVQAMYPSAAGTAMPTTWAAGETHTYTITGTVPSYVEKDEAPYMVVWLQDELDKNIKQAAQAVPLPPVPNDAAVTAIASTSGMTCVVNGPHTIAHSITIKNSGATTLTSATIYYKVGSGAMASVPWTGSLATGASATVVMPTVSVTVAGPSYYFIYDSVANPNGVADQSILNNVRESAYFVQNGSMMGAPFSTTYDNADIIKFFYSDNNDNGNTWLVYTGSATFGKTGTNAAGFNCYDYAAGESEYMSCPRTITSSISELTFWVAYAQYDASSNDKLEVVYSTDCGANWTSLWSASGSALKTVAPQTGPYTASTAQYVQKTVALGTMPVGATVAFRATSDYGNNMYIDDVNMTGPASVNKLAGADLNASIFPNPAKDNATLSFNLLAQTEVKVTVVDGLGRVVAVVTDGALNSGNHQLTINTANLASGVYNVMISTDAGTATQRLSVTK